jgi:hypothetical protein
MLAESVTRPLPLHPLHYFPRLESLDRDVNQNGSEMKCHASDDKQMPDSMKVALIVAAKK